MFFIPYICYSIRLCLSRVIYCDLNVSNKLKKYDTLPRVEDFVEGVGIDW